MRHDERELEGIKADRQKVYGDPMENHAGIAQMWASILQPWAPDIARGIPVPPHVVALCMALLKINRMRRVYHPDSYKDCTNYLDFSDEWQQLSRTPPGTTEQLVGAERIYVAGPYTAATDNHVQANVDNAAFAAAECIRRGHHVYCPHTMTHGIEKILCLDADSWLCLDKTFMDHWATSILYLAPSPGANKELAWAAGLGLKVYKSIEEVPVLHDSLADISHLVGLSD